MTTTPSQLTDAIADNAAGPKSVTADGMSVQQTSIEDQIKAAQYVAAQTAASKAKFGLRFVTLVPPGCG